MPYITQDRRNELNEVDTGGAMLNPGDLTYKLYVLCRRYTFTNGTKFTTFCVVMGALICTAFEFYRRVVAPHEDRKIIENGDV